MVKKHGKKKAMIANDGYKIVSIEGKGRCLYTSRPYIKGELVFNEVSFLYGTWHDHLCIGCDAEHAPSTCPRVKKMFPKEVIPHIQKLETFMVLESYKY